MEMNFPVKVGDTVYVVHDRDKDDYQTGDEPPYIIGEETVAYLAIGENDGKYIFTYEQSGMPMSMNTDECDVFVSKEDCQIICDKLNSEWELYLKSLTES